MKAFPLVWRVALLMPATAFVVGCDRSPGTADRIAGPRVDIASVPGPQFVTRAGTQLLLNGVPYRFTGLNIYNANSNQNCWYTMATGTALDDALNAIGPGKSAFRSWFFQTLATSGGQRDWSAFDHTLSVARSHGVKVIATLGNQWGDCEADGYKTDAWYTDGYKQRDPVNVASYRDWVTEVVTRYRDDPTILAWQLVNEAEVKPSADAANCSANAAAILKSFGTDVSGLVKSLDPNHLVSLGTMGGGQCGAQSTEYQDVHSVSSIDLCEYHDYQPNSPMPGDQWNGLQVRIDQCNALGKPLFVGETGIIPNDVGGTLATRASAFDAKLQAQFTAGVVGELVWAWSNLGSRLDTYDVGPKDPVLKVLARLNVATGLVFLVPPSASAAGQAISPAVQVAATDAFGATATSFGGSITIGIKSGPSGGILSGTLTATAVNGVATFADLSLNKTGTYTLKATASQLRAAYASVLIGPADPKQLVFVKQPALNTKAGNTLSLITVTARDRFGNTATGFAGPVTMAIATGPVGAVLFGTTTVTATSGTASFSTLVIQKAGSYTLRATADGLTAAISNAFTIKPNSPTHLAFTVQPTTTAPGAPIVPPVEVTVRDAYDNTVPITGSVTLALGSNPGGGTLSGTLTASASTGVATFAGLSINNAGTGYTLVATLGTLPTASSALFNIGVSFWAASSSMPTARVGMGVVAINGIVYAVGGYNNNNGCTFSTVEAYDPATDTWTTKAPMPTSRGFVSVAALNGMLYAVGGYHCGLNNGSVATVEAYDPATDTWSTKASLQSPRQGLGVAVINGILYAVGGVNSGFGGAQTTVEAYDPATDSWSTKASMPTARYDLGVAVVNDRLYAVGGYPSTGGAVEVYDPGSDSWSSKASLPTARFALGAGSLNGRLYAVGGGDFHDQTTAEVDAYDPVTNTWTTTASMPTARRLLGIAVAGGVMYAIGGTPVMLNDGANLATVEVFHP